MSRNSQVSYRDSHPMGGSLLSRIPAACHWALETFGLAGRSHEVAPPFAHKLLFETLEPRLLLSADLNLAAPAQALQSEPDSAYAADSTALSLSDDPANSGQPVVSLVGPQESESSADGSSVEDWWPLDLGQSDVIAGRVDTREGGMGAFSLSDASGHQIAADDNSGPGTDALTNQQQVLLTGAFYVQVGCSEDLAASGWSELLVEPAPATQQKSDRPISDTNAVNTGLPSTAGEESAAAIAFSVLAEAAPRELAATPISPSAATAMSGGVSGFTDWMGSLGTYEQFARALPAIQQSVGETLNIQDALFIRVSQPISSYLATDDTPTIGELQAILEDLDVSTGDLVFQSTVTNGGIFGTPGQEELRYDMVLDFQWTRALGLDLGVAVSDQLYLLDTSAEGDLDMELDLSLGVDLTPGLAPDDAFFIRPSALRMSFDLHVVDLNSGIAVGFLGADIHDGQIDAEADLAVAVANPDGDAQGRITLAELEATPLPSLVGLTTSGGLTADLPISVHLGDWELSGDPRISLTLSDPFSGEPPQVAFSADAGPAAPFRSLNATGVAGLLNQIAAWGDGWMTAPRGQTTLLDQAVPFTADRTLGDLLNVGQAIRAELLDPLQNVGGALPFRTAQELAAKLAEILEIPVEDTQLAYDPATHELSYGISLSHAYDPATVPLAFNIDLEPLASLSSTTTVELTPSLTAGMTFGVTLAPFTAAIEGATLLPTDGRLLNDATFQLSVAGGAATTVRVAVDPTNATRADLVRDVNAALLAADVPDIVTAGVNAGGHLTLTAARPTQGVSLVIGEVSAGAAELGLTADSNAVDTLADHAWLEDATFTGSVAVSAADIQAVATLGFLDIQITQGQASADVSISARLKNGEAGTPGGRVTIRDLFRAQSDDPLSIAAFQFAGTAAASLEHIQVVDNFLGVIEGNPSVTLDWAN